MRELTLFDEQRMGFEEALEYTAQSLNAYGPKYRHWAMAYSGGKDSSAAVSVVVHLIEQGLIKAPESLTVLRSDTRLELPPLDAAARRMIEVLGKRGIQARTVLPAMDDRYFVYMLGRGVPPPSNTFRWCTPQLKIEPMLRELEDTAIAHGMGERVSDEKLKREVYRGFGKEKLLMLTGVRIGESQARDQRIALSCGKNGAECGQGWFQESTPKSLADTLAPLLHWRVCFVWDWLFFNGPSLGFPTQLVAEAYGNDKAQEVNARTGCVGCNLASRDLALDTILQNPKWEYLRPLKELRELYAALKEPARRLRKDGSETRKDGSLVSNPCRMGPLTFDARRWGLERVLGIQERINERAGAMPQVWLIDEHERRRILDLIDAATWPRGWDGTEPRADVWFDNVNPDGSVQPVFAALKQELSGRVHTL